VRSFLFVNGAISPLVDVDGSCGTQKVKSLGRESNAGSCSFDYVEDVEEQLLLNFKKMIPIMSRRIGENVDVKGAGAQADQSHPNRLGIYTAVMT
jgi:hypothetical protein